MQSPSTNENTRSLVLRYWDDCMPPVLWFLRGIQPDGTYYGEIRSHLSKPRDTDGAYGTGKKVTGKLTSNDRETIFRSADSIAASRQNADVGDQIGILAFGPVNRPTVIFRHYASNDQNLSDARILFLGIVDILRPHMQKEYPDILGETCGNTDEQNDAFKPDLHGFPNGKFFGSG